MKAVSPVRSVHRQSAEAAAAVHRLAEERLLYDMKGCYSRLSQLVPTLATTGRKASRMEILQHVIDYILDLQVALDEGPVEEGAPGDAQVCTDMASLTGNNETLCC
ncbi:DNA-binding protein inhibitor ID-2 [Petromyzon marinus]|uniref:DNA-binding protein inhibitor ID-2 n=1 Tax=Petromyzon marinus TaxID=7757 RepID=S4R7A9_PETMA|nr:DNA-binding protein inhibitor ID-2 [Petromyzon marinus]